MTIKSKLRDFIAFLSTVRSDLANITAPPYFLAHKSVTELGICWTERPDIFIAPALEDNAGRRMLLVLKWFLAALRNLFYADGNVNANIKKPLNAFLGELFIASWMDSNGNTSQLVSEQVSHHPPITAVHMWNEEHGIWCTGYSRVEMTFAGFISVKITGYAHLHIDRYNEDYIIPLPDFRVKGFISGMLYPETNGLYYIVSTSGFTSEVCFEGKNFWGSGTKHDFTASVYSTDDLEKTSLYTARGSWSGEFSPYHADLNSVLETWDTKTPTSTPILPALSEQDIWETRKAW